MGPYLVSKDEIPDPHCLDMELRVNGEVRQKSNTGNLIVKIPRIVHLLSAGMTLEPGDIVTTGTPGGVGVGRVPPVFLKPGDVVEATIEKIGALRNQVVAED
jgi:2-keto-4-pentenoate hydratase/2-oxohepta-3-ene-1,7-dioic acid hydratase in catechol pathway